MIKQQFCFILLFLLIQHSVSKNGRGYSDMDFGTIYRASLNGSPRFQGGISLQETYKLRQEAELGNANAQYYMGLLKLYGTEVLAAEPREALDWFRKSAFKGQLQAKLAMGTILGGSGYGVEQDDESALEYLKEAAEAGEADAQWMLGRMYYDGRATTIGKPAFHKAKHWFTESAKAGNPKGQFYLGILCEYGLGDTKKDFQRAASLYKEAADQGDIEAKYYFALLLLQGRGVRKNSSVAATLLQECAKEGHAPAMNILGKLYVLGQGVEIDYHVAVLWLKQAKEIAEGNGDEYIRDEAGQLLGELQGGLQAAEKHLHSEMS